MAITNDFSSWYAGNTLFSFIVVMALSVYSFYISLAGQPIFQSNPFREELK